MASTPLSIKPGQVWSRVGDAQWAVKKRRARANGFVEVLIESAGGAKQWVAESDLREKYTLSAD